MTKDEDIVSTLLNEDVEFRRFKELHQEYEHQLNKLEKKHYLSDNEILEKKKIKKKKLAAKDKMEIIIKGYMAEHQGV